VFSLLAIYLSFSLFDIFYLHSYNPSAAQLPTISIPAHIDNGIAGSPVTIEFHRLFKTVMTSKNGSASSVMLATLLIFLVVGKLAFAMLGATQKRYSRSWLHFQSSIFLNLCTFRI